MPWRLGHNEDVDRDLREWLRGLAAPAGEAGRQAVKTADLSDEAADYLSRIALDGTLRAALAEIAASEPELAG
jgi:hypothetical protein